MHGFSFLNVIYLDGGLCLFVCVFRILNSGDSRKKGDSTIFKGRTEEYEQRLVNVFWVLVCIFYDDAGIGARFLFLQANPAFLYIVCWITFFCRFSNESLFLLGASFFLCSS